MYDEEKWFDMWVVPRDRLLEVFNRGDTEPPAPARKRAERGEAAAAQGAYVSTVGTETTLPDAVRTGVRDLVLVLADSKRLLGMRYAEWMLGAPELEAAIACSSMAQDEWGHARLFYALLRDFGDDVAHARARPRGPRLLQYRGAGPRARKLAGPRRPQRARRHRPLHPARGAPRHRPTRRFASASSKLLEEERFHGAHAAAWVGRFARGGPRARDAMADALQQILPGVLRWFGPDSPSVPLVPAGIADAEGSALRLRLAERVAPLFEELGITAVVAEPDFTGFDEARRRASRTGPDAETLARVRGDRNRAFLLD